MTTIAREADNRLVEWLKTCPRHDRALDVGCGVGTYASMIPAAVVVGIDAFSPYVEEARPKYSSVMFADVTAFSSKMFAPYDLFVFVDSLEHLSHKDGERLLKRIQKTAKTILVFTPSGYVPNDTVDGNPFNAHSSGWTVDELTALGFTVRDWAGYHSMGAGALFAHWSRT